MQAKIARQAGISRSFLSLVLSGKRRPSWTKAKVLSKVTGTRPELWLDGTPQQMKRAIKKGGRKHGR